MGYSPLFIGDVLANRFEERAHQEGFVMTRLVCLPVALIATITCQLVLAQEPQGGASATPGTAKPLQLTIHNKE
jgi:hypothetical protein